MKTKKEMRDAIIAYVDSLPFGSYEYGVYIEGVGTKYVTISNFCSHITGAEVPLEIFYKAQIEKCNESIEQLSEYIY